MLDMSSVFSKIIARELPGHFVYEDDVCVVIMDRFPAVPGQSIVITKEEIEYLFDVEDELYNHLCAVAKRVAKASDKVFNTEKTCLVVEGFEVPHVHIKLFPIVSEDLSLAEIMLQNAEATDETLKEHATKLHIAML